MSEEPDFGADCNKDSLENCKSRIEASDYYFLIIGSKPGFQFEHADNSATTVTLEEFRHFLKLKSEGKNINLIAFVRKQAWDYYTNKDYGNMPEIQHKFIEELVNNSLLDSQIGRWRYTFDKFEDLISVLETNQNGLFVEATRKISIYRNYLKEELTQIIKSLKISDKKDGKGIKSLKEVISLPKINFKEYFKSQKIDREISIHITSFIQFYSHKQELLLKINRIFNYIAQGEFAKFNAEKEVYELPEYIKMSIQALEILEGALINFQRCDLYKKIASMDVDNFYLCEFEYEIVKNNLENLNLVTSKLVNLMMCLHNNWTDFEKTEEGHYDYRGGVSKISTEEIIEFSKNYFKK